MEFLQEINWSPLWISLKTGAVATIIAFFLGIFCARKIMKMKPVSRAIWDGILTMPLVLPPTVAGWTAAIAGFVFVVPDWTGEAEILGWSTLESFVDSCDTGSDIARLSVRLDRLTADFAPVNCRAVFW